jgi:hypothetical protein
MDLSKLGKKAFFIPTPGQYEQEYLAEKLQKEGLVPYAQQDDFRIENLIEIQNYKGVTQFDSTFDWKDLFDVFQKKTEKNFY